MARMYPKHSRREDEAPLCEYDDFGRVESCHRPDRMDPDGLDSVESYPDPYTVPHEAPRHGGR